MNGCVSSDCHHPQPPSACWNPYSRSRPAFSLSRSASWSTVCCSFNSFAALLTIRSGRKLDMVCSTQPYGKDVKYSSALKLELAIEGVRRTVTDFVPPPHSPET